MILCTEDGHICLHILPKAVDQIQKETLRSYPLETGGILLGYYDSNYRIASVCMASPSPKDSKHGYTSFVRGTAGINELIKNGEEQEPPLLYLGEWHTHPANSSKPSQVDIHQMNLSAKRRLYGASTPVLVIIGGTPPVDLKWSATIHRAYCKHKYLTPL